MDLFNRILLNAIFIYGARIVEGVLQLAVLAFILSRVGREYYAGALLIISIQATIDLARGGVQKATLKYIAEYKAKGDLIGVNGVLSSSTALQGGVGFLGLLVCLVIAPFSKTLFSLPVRMQGEALWATILLGIGIALSLTISPWHNSVAAQERYDLLSVARVCGRLFRAGIIVILLVSDAPALISLVSATIAGEIVERLICIFFVKNISPELNFAIESISFAHIKAMVGFSVFDFFHTASGFLYSQGPLYLATHLISLDAVAALGIIGNIASLISQVTSQIAQMLVPMASRLNAQGNKEILRNIVIRGTTITVFVGGIVMTGIIPWLQSLLVVWLGLGYAKLVIPAVIMISATYLVDSLTCIHNSLGGVGKVAVDGVSNTLCTVLGLAIGAGLVYWADLGLLGLVVGLLCARGFRFLFVNWYGSVIFEFPMIEIYCKGYLRTYILVFIVCFLGLHAGFSLTSWFSLIAAGCLTAGLYFLLGVFWIVESVDRLRFFRAFRDGANHFRVVVQGQKI